MTFSILGRIGGDATRPYRKEYEVEKVDFQYPRSDRRRCNFLFPPLLIVGIVLLSVSSVGSEAMQRIALLLGGLLKPPFQYPRSDRRRCNASFEHRRLYTVWLDFQYPRSDRRRCNETGGLRKSGPACSLSVSSVGSEAMQW